MNDIFREKNKANKDERLPWQNANKALPFLSLILQSFDEQAILNILS